MLEKKVREFREKHGDEAALDLMRLIVSDALDIKATVASLERYRKMFGIYISLRNEFQGKPRGFKASKT